MNAMKKQLFMIAAGASALVFAAPAQASTIEYDVSDYNAGSSCSHGLWTNTLHSNNCAKRYSFNDGTTFTVDSHSGTGSFVGTATNAWGKTATLDLTLGGLVDALSGEDYKAGGGAYDPSKMDFFTAASGTIKIGRRTYTLANDPFAGDTTFQFGFGANDKTGAFGGSAWLNLIDPHGYALPHWDINFNLKERPGTPVPAPGGLALLALGLAGLWAGQRRRARA